MPTYQIIVRGHLDESWSEWFDTLAIAHQPDGTTALTGSVPDQARLFTILLKIRDMNLTLVLVEQIEAFSGDDRNHHQAAGRTLSRLQKKGTVS